MADKNSLLPGTLEERMNYKTELNEQGKLDVGEPEVMTQRWREWYAEHVRILTELGMPVAGEPPPIDEDIDDISDIDEYDDLFLTHRSKP